MYARLLPIIFRLVVFMALWSAANAQVYSVVRGNFVQTDNSSLPYVPAAGFLHTAQDNDSWNVWWVWTSSSDYRHSTIYYRKASDSAWKSLPTLPVSGECPVLPGKLNGNVLTFTSQDANDQLASLWKADLTTGTLTKVLSMGDIVSVDVNPGNTTGKIKDFALSAPGAKGDFQYLAVGTAYRGVFQNMKRVVASASYMTNVFASPSFVYTEEHSSGTDKKLVQNNPITNTSKTLIGMGQKFLDDTVGLLTTAPTDDGTSIFVLYQNFPFVQSTAWYSNFYNKVAAIAEDGTAKQIFVLGQAVEGFSRGVEISKIATGSKNLVVISLKSAHEHLYSDQLVVWNGEKISPLIKVGDVLDGQTITAIGSVSAHACTAEVPVFFGTAVAVYHYQQPCITDSPTGDVLTGSSVTVKGLNLSFPGHVTKVVDESGVYTPLDTVKNTEATFTVPSSGNTFSLDIDGVRSNSFTLQITVPPPQGRRITPGVPHPRPSSPKNNS